MRWDSDLFCSSLWTLHVSWERAAQGQHNLANRPLQIKFLKVNVPSEFLQVVLADTCRLGTRWEQLRWKLFGHHHVRKPSKNKILKHLCVALIDSSESDESNLKKCSGSSFACWCSFFSLSWFFPKASSGMTGLFGLLLRETDGPRRILQRAHFTTACNNGMKPGGCWREKSWWSR